MNFYWSRVRCLAAMRITCRAAAELAVQHLQLHAKVLQLQQLVLLMLPMLLVLLLPLLPLLLLLLLFLLAPGIKS